MNIVQAFGNGRPQSRPLASLTLGFAVAYLLCGCGPRLDGDAMPSHGRPASIIQLIARPDDFNGQVMSVKGFLVIRDDEKALYLHETDLANDLLQNAIPVGFKSMAVYKCAETLNRKYVRVVGRFASRTDSQVLTDVYGSPAPVLEDIQWIDPLPYSPVQGTIPSCHE